jgi:DMSO reductase anchor subunit
MVKTVMVLSGNFCSKGVSAKRLQHLISALAILSLSMAFFHLGRPTRAIYALNNVMLSPLSMEIASLSLLIGVSILMSWLYFRETQGFFNVILSVISAIAALLLLATMTAVYMIPSVPAWFSINTPLAFVLTVVSAGPATTALILNHKEYSLSVRLLMVATVAAIVLSILLLPATIGGARSLIIFFILQGGSALVAFVLVFSQFFRAGMNKRYRMIVITGILVLFSGILARLIFFLSYDNNIL